MRKSLVLYFLLAIALIFSTTATGAFGQQADEEPRLQIGADIVGGFQFLDHGNDDGSLTSLNPGFQNAAGNLNFYYQITDGIDLKWNFYMSNPTHLLEVTLTEGYAWIDRVPEAVNVLNINESLMEVMSLRVGQFYVNYGDQLERRSNNGAVQNNPLIGNYIMDPVRVGLGAEVYFDFDVVEAMFGFHQPGTQDFSQGQRNALLGMLALNLFEGDARLRGSFYSADASGNPPFPQGSRADLFTTTRTPARYMDVLAGQHQVLLFGGQDVTAYQLEANLKPGPFDIWGLIGYVEDANYNGTNEGTPEENWLYWGAEAKVDVTERFYLATRYSGASTDKFRDVDSDGNLHRVQGGFGFEIAPGILFKTEYVNQWFSDFEQNEGFDGLELTQNPRFYGIVTEISFSF